MKYVTNAELKSKSLDYGLGVTITMANNLSVSTSVPIDKGNPVSFEVGEEVVLSYYFGEFKYSFLVEFQKQNGDTYAYLINKVDTPPNHRREKRELIQLKGMVLDAKGMYPVVLLDVSDGGARLETLEAIEKKKVEVHFSDARNENRKEQGKIVWAKKSGNSYFYGIKFLK